LLACGMALWIQHANGRRLSPAALGRALRTSTMGIHNATTAQ
jgi:hypothetical protein